MKKLLLLALCLPFVGCTTTPPAPSPRPCTVVGECQHQHQDAYANLGLGPEHTVQLMSFSPMLIGGVPADSAQWPASVYARAGSSACSATIVGDRVVFIASHCVSDGGSITFTAHANSYSAVCTHHPEYRGNSTADWTLCLVDRPVTGVAFEVLGTDKVVALNQELLLSGYGCIKPGGGGGNDGIFRIGNAKVKATPYQKNYDIVTKGGAALCFGDSGGAAYLIGDQGARHIVAVNSRGNISTTSYLPAVYTKTFVEWAKVWAKNSSNARICGLHEDALGCRGGKIDPPQPDSHFELSTKAACVKGAVNPDYVSKKEAIVDSVKKALEEYSQ